MESDVRTAGLATVLVFAIYALSRRREVPTLVFVMFGPLSYFSQNIGIVLTPAKLIGLVFLGFILLNPKYISYLSNRYFGNFLAYYVYTINLTLIMALFWPEQTVEAQGFYYGNTMRGIVQIAQVIMGLAIVIMMISGLTSAHSLFRAQFALLLSMTLISIYGLYVWFAQRTGLPFNPIIRQGGLNPELNRVIATYVDGVRMVRAYSVTGEPKVLAVNASFGVILTYFTAANRSRLFGGLRGQLVLIPLFLVTLYLTLSTAGYLILPMVLLVALMSTVSVGQLSQRTVSRLVVFGIVALLAAFFSGYDLPGLVDKVTTILEDRVESRIGADGLFTFAEAAMVKFWTDSPFFVLTGVGLGGSSFYIRLYDTESYAGFVGAPRGIIGFIGDRGLIGLLLFGSALFKTSKVLVAAATSKSPNKTIYAGVLVICLVNGVFLLTYSLWYAEWLTVGLACSAATLAEREVRTVRTSTSAQTAYR